MIHPDLHGCGAMRGSQTKHGQRQADLVVEVSGRGEHVLVAEFGAQDRRRHLLHGRLAVAADDGDNRQHEAPAPERGERPERDERIGHSEKAACDAAGERFGTICSDDRRCGATLESLGDEIMTIEMLALERHEKIAGLQPA